MVLHLRMVVTTRVYGNCADLMIPVVGVDFEWDTRDNTCICS